MSAAPGALAPEGRFDLGDQTLDYRFAGPPPNDAPTILLLHEGLGSAQLWLDFPERLSAATGFGVLAYSRAGYGRSSTISLPRPLDYMTREAQGPLPRLIDAAGLKRVLLVGHSDGASIAAIHAGTVRDARIKGVVLIAPHFFTEPMGLAAIEDSRGAFDKGGLRERLARWHDDPDAAFRGWNGAWLDPGFQDWNITLVLDTIRVPVAVIQGEDDAYGTKAQVQAVEDNVPAEVEVHMLPRVGHSPHREAGAETTRIVAAFACRIFDAV